MNELSAIAERAELTRRLEKVRRGMARRKLDALLVFDRHNTVYLAGQKAANTTTASRPS